MAFFLYPEVAGLRDELTYVPSLPIDGSHCIEEAEAS
jgi:hypothetical protein